MAMTAGTWKKSPRRNTDQLRELLARQRRGSVFEPDRIGVDGIDADDGVGIERGLGIEAVASTAYGRFADPHERGIVPEALGIGVHPVDGLAIAPHEAIDRRLSRLQSRRIGDEDPDGLVLERSRIVAVGDDADFPLVDEVEAEGRPRPAYVDLGGHHLRQCRRPPPAPTGPVLDALFL